MIDSAIFDMDGLMFDTERLYVRALYEYVGPKTGVDFPMDGVLRTLGCNHADYLRIFPELFGTKITPEECAALVAEWMQREIEAHGVPVKPGLYTLLDALKANGFRLALATGTARPIATIYLDMTHTRAYFDATVCGDQVTHGKPDPEIFLLAAKALGAVPSSCAVFEDSINGLRAARRGGFFTVCVPDLVDPRPLLDFTPDAVLPSLDRAVPLLCKN